MIATGLFLMACSAIMLSSHIGRSTVGILLAEGMRDFFWRTLVVIVLVVLIATRTMIQIDQFFLLSSAGIGVALMVQIAAISRRLPRQGGPCQSQLAVGRWVKVSSGFCAFCHPGNHQSVLRRRHHLLVSRSGFCRGVFIGFATPNMFAVPSGALHQLRHRRILRCISAAGSMSLIKC